MSVCLFSHGNESVTEHLSVLVLSGSLNSSGVLYWFWGWTDAQQGNMCACLFWGGSDSNYSAAVNEPRWERPQPNRTIWYWMVLKIKQDGFHFLLRELNKLDRSEQRPWMCHLVQRVTEVSDREGSTEVREPQCSHHVTNMSNSLVHLLISTVCYCLCQ